MSGSTKRVMTDAESKAFVARVEKLVNTALAAAEDLGEEGGEPLAALTALNAALAIVSQGAMRAGATIEQIMRAATLGRKLADQLVESGAAQFVVGDEGTKESA